MAVHNQAPQEGLVKGKFTVLVILGFLVLGQYLPSLKDKQPLSFKQMEIMGLATTTSSSALYLVDTTTMTWTEAYRHFGIKAPALIQGKILRKPDSNTSYLLADERLPDSRQAPSWLAPLFLRSIDINKASIDTLTLIPGIGPKLAANIVTYRRGTGGRILANELTKINGIGPAKAAVIRKYSD